MHDISVGDCIVNLTLHVQRRLSSLNNTVISQSGNNAQKHANLLQLTKVAQTRQQRINITKRPLQLLQHNNYIGTNYIKRC